MQKKNQSNNKSAANKEGWHGQSLWGVGVVGVGEASGGGGGGGGEGESCLSFLF